MGTVLVSEALVKAPDVIFYALFENEGPRARFVNFTLVFKKFHAGRPIPAQPSLIRYMDYPGRWFSSLANPAIQ